MNSFLVCLLILSCLSVVLGQNGEERLPLHAANLKDFGDRYEPLANWLWNLKVVIPDQKFKESIFTIKITGMTCTHFTVKSVDSVYTPSDDKADDHPDPSIDLSVTGISASCQGKYASTGLGGSVEAKVESMDDNGPALELSVTFVSVMHKGDGFRMANSTQTQECTTNLDVPADGLNFSGSISAKIINMFKSTIAGYVSSALSSELCPVLETDLDSSLTNLIQKADHYIDKIIPDQQEPAAAESRQLLRSENPVQWKRDTPLLVDLLELANRFLDRYMNKGFFVDAMNALGFTSIQGDCGNFFNGINQLVSKVTHGEVHFLVPKRMHRLRNMTFVVPGYAAVSILPKEAIIQGLDSLEKANFFRPKEDNLFRSAVKAMKGLNVTLRVDLEVSSIPGGAFQGDQLMESFMVIVNMTSFAMSGDLSLRIDLPRFQDVTAGQIISAVNGSKPDLGCLLCPIESMDVPALSSDVDVPSISFAPVAGQNKTPGELERDLDHALNNVLALFLTEYSVLVTRVVSGLSMGPLRRKVRQLGNDFIDRLLNEYPPTDEASCQAPPLSQNASTDFLNFNHVGFLRRIRRFLNSTRFISHANEYVGCVKDVLNDQVLSQISPVQFSDFNFSVNNALVGQLGILSSIDFLSPEDGCHLHYGFNIASTPQRNSSSGSKPALSASVDVSSARLGVDGQINVSSSVGDVAVSGLSLLLYDVARLRRLALTDLLTCGYCAIQPASEIVFYPPDVSMGSLGLGLSLNLTSNGSSPLTLQLSSSDYPVFFTVANTTLSWFMTTITDWINGFVAYTLPRTKARCGANAEESDGSNTKNDSKEDSKVVETLLYHIMPFFLLAQIAFYALTSSSEEEEEEETSLTEPLLDGEQHVVLSDEAASDIDPKDEAIITDSRITDLLKHGFPILTICTIALLASSNLSVGASVDLRYETPTSTMTLPSLFSFSLANTVVEMYHARIYALLGIVVVFSGVWPYAKLLLIGLAWIAPKSILDCRQRERVLETLDALSKFSLVDTFVLVLMMVSFRFHVDVGGNVFDIFVNPKFGFYGFLAATTLSLLLGHVALYVHRQCTLPRLAHSFGGESVLDHRFKHGSSSFHLSRFFKAGVLLTTIAAGALLVLGSTQTSFNFEIGGLAGTLVERKRSYSLLTLGLDLPNSVQNPGLGLISLQVVYFFYALVTPLLCLVSLLVLGFFPMTPAWQRGMLVVAEVANAWSAIEVFVLSVVVALFEISTFASFIVGHKCDAINQVLDDQDLVPGENKCFSLRSSLNANVWILILGVVLNSMVVSVMLRFARVAIEDRYHPNGGEEVVIDRALDGQDDVVDVKATNIAQLVCGSSLSPYLVVPEEKPATPRILRADTDATERAGNRSK